MWVKLALALLFVINTGVCFLLNPTSCIVKFCSVQAKVLKREAQEYYEPVWNGKGCKDPVDVGRGKGSCNTDCDCPLCSPFCSTSGFCQNHKFAGRRKIALDLCPQPALPPKVEASCPPVPGGQATPGCDLTLIQDNYGQIDCQEDDDCPYRYSVFITSD